MLANVDLEFVEINRRNLPAIACIYLWLNYFFVYFDAFLFGIDDVSSIAWSEIFRVNFTLVKSVDRWNCLNFFNALTQFSKENFLTTPN